MPLRDAIDATRHRFEAEPARAHVTVRAEARLEGGTEVNIRTGAHTLAADEPASMGGGGTAANPVQLVLASLSSCQAITYRYWAELLGIQLDAVSVRLEGDVDVRGFLGFEPDPSPGLSAVRCTVVVEGPEDPGRYEELAAAVDAHCPVLDVFTRPVPVERRLEVG
jgi:uncharacterized OsmC-like protein